MFKERQLVDVTKAFKKLYTVHIEDNFQVVGRITDTEGIKSLTDEFYEEYEVDHWEDEFDRWEDIPSEYRRKSYYVKVSEISKQQDELLRKLGYSYFPVLVELTEDIIYPIDALTYATGKYGEIINKISEMNFKRKLAGHAF